MKTTVIAGIAAVSLLAASSLTVANAGQGEWALAGKVLTGVVAAGVVAHALQPAPTTAVVYQSAPPVYYQSPAPVVYQAPPTVVYYSAPAPVYYPAPVVVYRPGCYPIYRHYRRW